MFRACLPQGSRAVASSSALATSCIYTRSAVFFHTSNTLRASKDSKKSNTLIKQEKRRQAIETRPHVVLGSRPGDTNKWTQCDLAKAIIIEEDLRSPSSGFEPTSQPIGTVQTPKYLNFGVGEIEKEMLFRHLPMLSAQASVLGNKGAPPELLAENLAKGQESELFKANNFAKVIDLRNANAEGIAYENRRRIIHAFSTPENPYDTGRVEVQAALLTYKIRNLYSHLTNFRRDVGNRRGLRKLIHKRAKILRYLKRSDRQRYESVLERLGLEPESVEGELVV